MLALAKSALNLRYQDMKANAIYDDGHGYIELTNYGEWLYSLTGSDLLCEIAPWIDASALEVHEVDRLLWFICGVPIPPPPPPEQLSLF